MSTYKAVCEARTKTKMQKAFGSLLKEIAKKFGGKPEDHRMVQLSNVGYFAGYYSPKVRENVYKWLGAIHPVFGIVNPTPEQAMKAGQRIAKRRR